VSGERLFMTKDHGTIEVITDGHRIQINTEKKPVD
jgi:hypothetical protein